MFLELILLILSALGIYSIYTWLFRCLFGKPSPTLRISEGIHVRLGFCEIEIEEALEILSRSEARYANAPPVLLIDCPLRREVLEELSELSGDLYLSYEEYCREKRRTDPPQGEADALGERRGRDLSE